MSACAECAVRCELHGVTRCITCHNHPGECEYGGCTIPTAYRLTFRNEVRRFCEEHATSPYFAFARTGALGISKETS